MQQAHPSTALVIESGGVLSNERSGRVIELGGPRTIEVRWSFLNINMQQAFSGSSEVDAEKQSVPLIEGVHVFPICAEVQERSSRDGQKAL